MMNAIVRVDEASVRFVGRSYTSPVDYFHYSSYTGSGISFTFSGTNIDVYVKSTTYSAGFETYIKAIVDGKPDDIKVTREGWYSVAKDLPDTVHEVMLLKRNDANMGALAFCELRLDDPSNMPRPTEDRPKIVYLGDSISCGFGNLYTDSVEEGTSAFEDGYDTFCFKSAQLLDMEPQIIAISGIGVARNCGGDKSGLLAHLFGTADIRGGKMHSFNDNDVRAVVIEAGVNDVGGGTTEDELVMQGNRLIDEVRNVYPNAHIVWIYGLMGKHLSETIKEIVNDRIAAGDKNLSFLEVEEKKGEGTGLFGHPTVKTHRRVGEELAAHLKDKI